MIPAKPASPRPLASPEGARAPDPSGSAGPISDAPTDARRDAADALQRVIWPYERLAEAIGANADTDL